MMNRKELFKKHLGQTTEFPMEVEIERSEGIYLYGPNEESYVDLISGISVSVLGHQHPKIKEAVHHQVDQHMHVMVYGEYIQSPQVRLGELLAQTLPPNLHQAFLVNSGSEAVEGALKLAKRYTGRRKLISCKNAYHGSTHGALSVGGDESLKQAYRPLLPETYQIRFNEIQDLDLIDEQTAAVIIECIQGEAGVIEGNIDFLQTLYQKCQQTGTLLICDEIQTGMGRTGKFWAFEHYGIFPDIITTAKGLGGGMPIGAFISSHEIMHSLTNNPILGHITTFGGHPVSAAAAAATLEELIKGDYIAKVNEKEKLFIKHLQHPEIIEVRSKGLLMAVEFKHFDLLLLVIHKAVEEGILSDWFLFNNISLRIAPPLTITETEIIEVTDKLKVAIDKALMEYQL